MDSAAMAKVIANTAPEYGISSCGAMRREVNTRLAVKRRVVYPAVMNTDPADGRHGEKLFGRCGSMKSFFVLAALCVILMTGWLIWYSVGLEIKK